ncbi:hypothetical protein AB0E12_06810 [Micromonospora chersina]|uniref:ATP-binding protein n=1 Tax=Micromonospora chersina TaxID=47854 RepID=UPI0033F191CE
MTGVLSGLYTDIAVDEYYHRPPTMPDHDRWGWVIGVPDAIAMVDRDENAIDALVRAMGARPWTALVLAQPVSRAEIKQKRGEVLDEIRRAETDTQGKDTPLIENYVELLTVQLKTLNTAAIVGAWRVATYLGSSGEDYPRLAAAWTSLFSGRQAQPDPVRAKADSLVGAWAAGWAMPDQAGPPSHPGRYQYANQFQSMLSSTQLAQYIQLPQTETDGFTVAVEARFDTARPHVEAPAIDLGITDATRAERRVESPHGYRIDGRPSYRLTRNDLTRHVFIAGVTGAGKTSTIFELLRQVRRGDSQVPFLVLEPAKTEYRALMNDPHFPDLQVYTLGLDTVSPLRLNPLQVQQGTAVSEHLDLLKSLFTASFGMWNPMPQILERALHSVYADAGWDLNQDVNYRVHDGDRPAAAFPTLSALQYKVEEIIGSLGYSGEVVSNLRAGLSTRLEALCIGGKGSLLDTTDTISPDDLFGRPTVLELEGMGDDDDKAFVMGLVLIQLLQYRRRVARAVAASRHTEQGQGVSGDALRHVIVVEEAHRLLTNTSPGNGASIGQADPRGKAVEAFTNLLAEIRTLGQSVIVSDQVPVRLAPEVIKNSNLKIAHRIVAGDDRQALGVSMNMTDEQIRDLATLEKGNAIIFSEGDDGPIRVKIVPPAYKLPGLNHDELRTRMAHVAKAVMPTLVTPIGGGHAVTLGRRIARDPLVSSALSQLLVSAALDLSAPERLWLPIGTIVAARTPEHLEPEHVLAHTANAFVAALSDRWTATYSWSLEETRRFKQAAISLLVNCAGDPARRGAATEVYREVAAGLLVRSKPRSPFPRCGAVCGSAPGVCYYRGAAADVLRNPAYRTALSDADADDERTDRATGTRGAVQALLTAAKPMAADIVDTQISTPLVHLPFMQAHLCLVQQHIMTSTRRTPADATLSLANLGIPGEET